MLDIYVLEDNVIQQFRMEREIATIMAKNNWDYQRIEVFSSANEIIAKATEKGEHQIFFLDLEIRDDEKQGIDVAKAIRERIELCLKEAMKHQNDNFGENSFLFETPKARVRVLYSDILYFETAPAVHRVILHTKNERVEFYATIAEIAKSDKRLFKCHRSFIINVDNVVRFDKATRSVYFETGESCLVSRDKIKPLLNEMR
ncbi:LytR/AlgR family response regulator transcription factor [Streptococcus gallolyticus]|jgi:two-component system response regulator AgrA